MASGRTPEPWETNAAAPFLTIDSASGAVGVRSLGQDRFRVSAPDHEKDVAGFAAARSMAHELAGRAMPRRGNFTEAEARE
jgi:hypothetical protein